MIWLARPLRWFVGLDLPNTPEGWRTWGSLFQCGVLAAELSSVFMLLKFQIRKHEPVATLPADCQHVVASGHVSERPISGIITRPVTSDQ